MNKKSSFVAERHQLLYVGIDIHKDSHTAVATNCFGQNLLELKITNFQEDFDNLITQVEKLSKVNNLESVFGLEDSYGNGLRLAKYLCHSGQSVKMVSPVLVDRERQYETHPEKSDSLDALGVAKVLIKKIDTLPDYTISKNDDITKEIKELVIDRDFLVKEQTRIKNHLHRLLHKGHNSGYREKFKNPFSLKALKYWHRSPVSRKNNDIVGDVVILKKQVKRKIKRLLDIREEIEEIEQELDCLIEKTDQKIRTLNGCGTVVASQLLAEVRNIDRFHSPHALAKYAGVCPRERSSGKTKKHVKTKSGNRRLNTAIHRIALTQISNSGNQYAKAYFQKKISEGKSKSQALCSLKRRLVDIIFMMLKHREEYNYSV